VIAKIGPHRGSYSGLYAPDPRAKTRVARMDEWLNEWLDEWLNKWLFMTVSSSAGCCACGCAINCKQGVMHACMKRMVAHV